MHTIPLLTPASFVDRFRKKCGLPLMPCFGALKLRWLIDNVAAVRSAKQAGTLMFG